MDPSWVPVAQERISQRIVIVLNLGVRTSPILLGIGCSHGHLILLATNIFWDHLGCLTLERTFQGDL